VSDAADALEPEQPSESVTEQTLQVDGRERDLQADGREQTLQADGPAQLARVVEALLFLSSDPLSLRELADVTQADEQSLAAALELLGAQYAPGLRGLQLRELAGGYTLASDPLAEDAARRLFNRPRAATLTPAQAETLAIVAYLQPVSRPEITRIRGVSADSAAATLLERGLIEEAGRSQFGAVLYRTGARFLKLFGLRSLQELPDVARWDPSPEEQSALRERLINRSALSAGTGGGEPAAASPLAQQFAPPAQPPAPPAQPPAPPDADQAAVELDHAAVESDQAAVEC
jgi:segregation and condensation protein B